MAGYGLIVRVCPGWEAHFPLQYRYIIQRWLREVKGCRETNNSSFNQIEEVNYGKNTDS
jgi:hypothetical protein